MNADFELSAGFDSRAFRDALGMFATGIAVITTRGPGGRRIGLTVNSFNSVSLDPPLIVWSLSLYSPLLQEFERCERYAVNILAADQVDLSQRFASSFSDKFGDIETADSAGGVPLLQGCCAWLECRNEARHPGGDHLVFIGMVERIARADRDPLLYFRGRYRTLSER